MFVQIAQLRCVSGWVAWVPRATGGANWQWSRQQLRGFPPVPGFRPRDRWFPPGRACGAARAGTPPWPCGSAGVSWSSRRCWWFRPVARKLHPWLVVSPPGSSGTPPVSARNIRVGFASRLPCLAIREAAPPVEGSCHRFAPSLPLAQGPTRELSRRCWPALVIGLHAATACLVAAAVGS